MSSKRQAQPYQIKGVDALFGESTETETVKDQILLSQVALPKQQPRHYFDVESMQKLIASIRQHGILQPLLVRPKADGKYELVAGERRYRAAKEIGLKTVPIVSRQMSDEEAIQVALLENLQREDLNPVEETEGILQLLALKLGQNSEDVIALLNQAAHPDRASVDNVIHSQEWQSLQDVFNSVGRFTPESFRTNRLPLLNLPDDVLQVLREGRIAYTKARAIARIKNTFQRQEVLDAAVIQNLSLNQIKEQIAKLRNSPEEIIPSPNLRTRFDQAFRVIKRSKVWDDPKRQRRLKKLLAELEALASEET